MRMQNTKTGDVLEMTPPGSLGESVLKLNGVVIEHLLFSDETDTVTLGNGRMFRAPSPEFTAYFISLLEKPRNA